MLLIIAVEIMLIVAVALLFVMKRKITKLMNENIKLHERIYQLKNSDREKALNSDDPYWYLVSPSDFVDEINERTPTLLN